MKRIFLFAISITFFAVIACSNISQIAVPASAVPTSDQDLLGTIIAETVDAATTQTAASVPLTFTPTLTLTKTPEPSPTVTFTPPSSSFKPGDPTATPLGSDITDSNYIEGVKAYDAKNFEDVISLMNAVIDANPELAPPYRYRGITYMQLGDCPNALVDFEQALLLNPNYALAWAGRGVANGCLGDETREFLDYQKALSIDPSLAFVHHNLGVYYYDNGDYKKSLEEYSLVVAIDPNRANAWSGKAEALFKLGRSEECIVNANKAIEINPEEWLAYSDRAFCEDFTGDYVSALKDYKIYATNTEATAETWYNLGLAQRKAGDSEGAIISYNKALEIDPSYYQAYINRGYAYLTLEKHKEALNDYNKALGFGDIPAAYSGRGDAYYGLGEYNKAIEDYKKATELNPYDAHSYCYLSSSYFEVEKYQDSIDAAESAHDINPECGGQELIQIEARSYYALGNYDQALTYINKALAKGDYALGHYYRGIFYQAAGKNQEAIQDLEYFVSTSQSHKPFQEEIADAKARLVKLKK